jgi:hypothetical protein
MFGALSAARSTEWPVWLTISNSARHAHIDVLAAIKSNRDDVYLGRG